MTCCSNLKSVLNRVCQMGCTEHGCPSFPCGIGVASVITSAICIDGGVGRERWNLIGDTSRGPQMHCLSY